MKLLRLAMVVGLGLASVSCGGSGGAAGPGASGLEKSRSWNSLTAAEKGILCDWVAAKFGGYGKTIDCGNGTGIGSNTSQQACIDSLPATCAATVAAYEQCADDASCETGPFPPSCAPLLACFK
jgi:hypothetical protein